MNVDWLSIGPETLYWVPRLAAKIWDIETIYISENGTAGAYKPAADGKVYDLDRIMYAQLPRAAAACDFRGRAVRGYFL
jgi:beta-glucosidase